jgi:hypothetical protein
MGPECSNNHKGSEVCIIANSLRTGPPGLRAARRKEGLHGTLGFLGSSIRIETGASDWLTLVDKITKNVNNSILNFIHFNIINTIEQNKTRN